MKRKLLITFTAAVISLNGIQAQDLHTNQVPSVILNHFNQNHPKARDIEWEKEGDLFKVEFETGWSTDHEAWYNTAGEMVRKVTEISRKELPETVLEAINKEFKGFKIEDVKKITSKTETTYSMDLDSKGSDWEVTFSKTGELLSKRAD